MEARVYLLVSLLALTIPALSQESHEGYLSKFNLGSSATPEEIKAWDTDIKPDGAGLPEAVGTVLEGQKIYNLKCLVCHGLKGKNGPQDQLAGHNTGANFDFGNDRKLRRTVGNYWPYATTLFDYIWRAMPQIEPGSLSPEEVYSLTAYILNLNKIIPEDLVMNAETLPKVVMPARNRFYVED